MNEKKWKLGLLLALLILVVSLIAQWVEPSRVPMMPLRIAQESTDEDLRSYLPNWSGVTYYFAGEGNEYASFIRQVTFTTQEAVQIEDSSGTTLAQVVEYDAEELKVVWSEEELYEQRSLLNPVPKEARLGGHRENLVLLKAPVAKGTRWDDDRFQREIVSVNQVVTVPLGTFHNVVVVKNKSLEADNWVQYEYYAKNMGLIKRESLYVQDGETYAVVSSLADVTTIPQRL